MRRTKRALPRDIHDTVASLLGFEVVAVWDDKLYTHWALNAQEAQEWADQYAATSAHVRIWTGSRQITCHGNSSQTRRNCTHVTC